MSGDRDSFSGKIGFILTAAGAAVGLGCFWRFPNLVSQYGGGLFIILYTVLLVTIGVILLAAEIAVGRITGTGALGAFKAINNKFGFVGYLCLVVCLLIQPYYTVLAAHTAKYAFMFTTGQIDVIAETGYYTEFTSTIVEPIVWTLILTVLVGVIVFLGVRKGLERACKILLPAEAVLLVSVVIYCLTIPGALDGLYYYICPDFTKLNGEIILAALGQVFYSLTIGFGIMLTLGSYMSKKTNLVSSVLSTGFFTLFMSIIAGMLIIPATFMYTGGNPELLGSGSVFASLPQIFEAIPYGTVVGAVFFILLCFAAVTSNITSLEMLVASVKDKFGISRAKSVIIMSVYTLALAIPISLGYNVLDWINFRGMNLLEIFDYVSGTLLLPITALFICILAGYFADGNKILNEIKLSSKFKHDKLFTVMIKYICPTAIILILIYGVVGSYL